MGELSEREKEILEKISDAIPHMSEFELGYLLGVAESLAARRTENTQDKASGESA